MSNLKPTATSNFNTNALPIYSDAVLQDTPTQVDELPKYIPELRCFIAGKTGDAYKVDDIAQEVIARTYKSANISQLKNPLAYMITVAKTVLFDQWRSAQDFATDLDPDTLPCESGAMDKRHMDLEKIEAISQALNRMPPLRRKVFEMRRLHGISREEISKRLGISIESVKKHINRAMVDITVHMEKQGW